MSLYFLTSKLAPSRDRYRFLFELFFTSRICVNWTLESLQQFRMKHLNCKMRPLTHYLAHIASIQCYSEDLTFEAALDRRSGVTRARLMLERFRDSKILSAAVTRVRIRVT